MHTIFDIERWNRKHTYHFFKTYDDPFFNLCSTIDVTHLRSFSKSNALSFHFTLLHSVLRVVNETLEFRLRLLDGSVVLFDTIDCGSTVLHDDNTFTFCYFPYTDSAHEFNVRGKQIVQWHLQHKLLDPRENELNMIYCSSIPWTSFTSISHAKKFKSGDSIPRFAFGKYFEENKRLRLPISIEVNHALMDGYHVGKFLNDLQDSLDQL